MLVAEKPFDFRKRMLRVDAVGIADMAAQPLPGEVRLEDGLVIYSGVEPLDTVAEVAALGFVDFLRTSMGVSARLAGDKPRHGGLRLQTDTRLAAGEYRIDISTDGTVVAGQCGRAIAQGLYHLERTLCARHAPFLAKGVLRRKPLFSPRMTHSGYGLDDFPDAHLHMIARAGMDAILVFCQEANQSTDRPVDVNTLISRAACYGLDVYAYSYISSERHPDDPDAEAYYESTYGQLFKTCPGLKGVVLVGESVGFPSKDPAATPHRFFDNERDGIPNEKPTASTWPCRDYPQWLSLVSRVIRGHSPKADIVFWTYNFGYAPQEARLELIRALPTDISLLVTFEMFETGRLGQATSRCEDYTLSFAGPGQYFASEAQAAHERGIRLYAMSNTGGLTWDIGVIPYEPMPQQWLQRHQALREAQTRWGLCGLMESHHYGFWPSFISDLARETLESPVDDEAALARALSVFGAEHADLVEQALSHWSKAITHYTPTVEDQYGAFRVGPAYPFCLHHPLRIPEVTEGHLNKGFYNPFYPVDNSGGKSPSAVRISPEIASLEQMLTGLEAGLERLRAIPNPNDALLRLANMGAFMVCCVHTGIHAKHWHLLASRLKMESDAQKAASLCDQLEHLADTERENVQAAIPLVRADSRLGWEPKMGYCCCEEQLLWKLRELDYVVRVELRAYRGALGNEDNYEWLYYGQF